MLPVITVKTMHTEQLMNHNESLEEMKCRLKSGLLSFPIKAYMPCERSKALLMNDLSQSLPNLVACTPDCVAQVQLERQVRSSCSDIYDNDSLMFSKTTKEVALMSVKEDGNGHPQCISKLNQRTSAAVTVSLTPNNNRLSAVLQNIPLLYIPGTKQLISPIDTDHTISTSKSDQSSPGKNPASEDGQFNSDGVNVEEPSHKTELEENDRERHCSKSESEISNCSLASSQPISDVSHVSDKTVTESFNVSGTSEKALLSECCRNGELDEVSLSDYNENEKRSEVPLIRHVDTADSLQTTDAVSFSSISSISTGTEFSLSAASVGDDIGELRTSVVDVDDGGFTEVSLHNSPGNTFERSRNSSQDSGFEEKQTAGAKPKRRGFSSFLTRSIFSRKPKEPAASVSSAPGWKLFGRVPPKESQQKEQPAPASECEQKPTCQMPNTVIRSKKTDIEVTSTTGLILQTRPQGLPSKTPEEERKHRQEYEAMVEAAKKREIKEMKLKKKQMQRQLKNEDALAASLQTWTKEILPNWDSMYQSKKARDLWWLGLPPSIRGRVWTLAIGNDLNLTNELYDICVNRAKDRLERISEDSDTESINEPASCKESSVELIKLDISRTFPQLCIFQKGGPYHDILHSLLGAYVCYRPDVGYVQGMSFIAAVLLLNMDANDAFTCFANLLNQPCQIAFFRLDENLMKSYFDTYQQLLEENLPKLHAHFLKQGLSPDLYLIDWMFTLYSKSLPLDVASRVWDVFCRDGEEFLFRTALGILKLYEDVLLNMDFIHLAQFLTKLPENLPGHKLFSCIERIHMVTDNKSFSQVLAACKDSS